MLRFGEALFGTERYEDQCYPAFFDPDRLVDRLHLEDVPLETEIAQSAEKIVNAPESERISLAMMLIYDFVTNFAYAEEAA